MAEKTGGTNLTTPSGGGAPSGAAGGDLAGTYPNPTVKASVGLTGTPTAPTAAVDTNTTQVATTAMVLAQAASATPLIDATSAVVGTSTRFARGDHVHPTDTTRAALASPTFTGTPAAPTPTAADNSTKIATTAYADTADALKSNLASPTFTGTPAAPTAAVDTNTTQLATTAMVLAQAGAATPLADATTAVVGTSTRFARADHVHPTGGLLGPSLIVARSTDSSPISSSTTLASDSVLLWPVSGNSSDVWFFEAHLILSAANTTMNAKVGWATPPAGTTIVWGFGYVAGAAAPGSGVTTGSWVVPLTESGSSLYHSGSPSMFAYASGFVYVGGTSGNVNLAWTQNTSDAGNLVMKKGSHLRLTRVV